MSGGFFRGTSADQDTRFSNKQAKLRKSQKFPAELDHLIDTSKVAMDLIRPWIATRATEFLGFEDEVLINFIYGMLDGKAVDGKEIQIQITGFMEKNTAKFMKELWVLLLSGMGNASGVPQQFLDAKAEEAKKNQVENDRIALEIRTRREKDEREKPVKMDDEIDKSILKRDDYSDKDGEADGRRGRRANYRDRRKSRSMSGSSQSPRHSISPKRRYRSPRRRSISLSRRDRSSPQFSISPRRRSSPQSAQSPSKRATPPRLSISPHQRHSPEIGEFPSRNNRQRSRSNSHQKSPSPSRRRSPHARRRSPFRRYRSPSPVRRRSPSPSRRRSPVRRRSPPLRRRSPVRRRSPSPSRRRSPSPSRRRSPVRRRYPSPSRRKSPVRRRSPSPPRRRSPVRKSPSPSRRRSSIRSLSPVGRISPSSPRRRSPPPRFLKNRRSPGQHAGNPQSSPQQRRRSRSPYRSRSPSYRNRRDLSREPDNRTNGVDSKRTREQKSPLTDSGRNTSDSKSHRLPTSLMSPQRNTREQIGKHDMLPNMPPEESEEQLNSPIYQKASSIRDGREETHDRTHSLQSKSKHLKADEDSKKFHPTDVSPKAYSSERSESRSPSYRGNVTSKLTEGHMDERDMELAEKHARQVSSSPVTDDVPRKVKEENFSSIEAQDKQQVTKQYARTASSLDELHGQATKHSTVAGLRVTKDSRSRSKTEGNVELEHETGSASRLRAKLDKNNPLDSISSDATETEAYTKKRRHKKVDRNKRHADDDSESESEEDDRKMAKRRRKEEKKLRKEERRQRREERHHRKSERRAGKLTRSMDTVASPLDTNNARNGSGKSDGDSDTRMVSHSSDTEPESDQKKLEIELRKKALESLRAKKAISD